MTLYSNAQSGLVATNVQSAIDELNSNLSSNIIYRIVTIDSINTNQYGYVEISSYKPNVDGYSILNANIYYWGAGLPYNVTSNGDYLTGTPSSQITSLKIKYILIKND